MSIATVRSNSKPFNLNQYFTQVPKIYVDTNIPLNEFVTVSLTIKKLKHFFDIFHSWGQ